MMVVLGGFEFTEDGSVRVTTTACPECGESGELILSGEGFEKFLSKDGARIQDAFPELSAAEREMLMTGTHGECWKVMTKRWKDEEEHQMLLELSESPGAYLAGGNLVYFPGPVPLTVWKITAPDGVIFDHMPMDEIVGFIDDSLPEVSTRNRETGEKEKTCVLLMYVRNEGLERKGNTISLRSGSFLESYDPEYAGGEGKAKWTPHAERAMAFSSSLEAVDTWQAIPKAKPWREDGYANRPLSAYSCVLEPHVHGPGCSHPPRKKEADG